MNGKWTEWRENGKKESETHYKDDKQHGKHIVWHENGKKKSEIHFKDGTHHGKWTEWRENGKKESEALKSLSTSIHCHSDGREDGTAKDAGLDKAGAGGPGRTRRDVGAAIISGRRSRAAGTVGTTTRASREAIGLQVREARRLA